VSARDSLTAVFHYKRRLPDQFFEAVYQVIPMPEQLLKDANRGEMRATAFAKQPVGNGQFRLASWTPGQRVEIIADTTSYRGRPKLDRVVWAVYPDPAAATGAVMAGQADLYEILSRDQLKEFERHDDLKAVAYPGLEYAFMMFNTRAPNGRGAHPLLGDRELRRALTMALDRQAMIRNVFDTLAAVPVGPVPRGLKPDTSSLRQLAYDTVHARALLDSLGWKDANGDGVREKNGRPLAFSLLVPASSSNRRKYAVLIQEQLRRVGVKANLEQLEFNVFMDRQLKRDFDAALGSYHADPAPGSIRQVWGSAGCQGDGSNYGCYTSRAFDAAVDSALSTMDPAKTRAYFARAYQTIVDDAPAVWLYEPRNTAGMHKRIQPVRMRADGWWSTMGLWSIPADQRIERDRIPLGAQRR
jgi:peptide/nickel transport system substrate-binding protein